MDYNLTGAPIAVLEWYARVLDDDGVWTDDEKEALKRLVCCHGEFGKGMRNVYAKLQPRLNDQELILVVDAAWRCAFIPYAELRIKRRDIVDRLLAIETIADELADKLDRNSDVDLNNFDSLTAGFVVGDDDYPFAPFTDAMELLKLASGNEFAWEREIAPKLREIPRAARDRLLVSPAAQLRAMAYRASQIRGCVDELKLADPVLAAGIRKREHSDITAFLEAFSARRVEDGTFHQIQLTPAIFAKLASAALGQTVNTETIKQQIKRAKKQN